MGEEFFVAGFGVVVEGFVDVGLEIGTDLVDVCVY